MIPNTTQLIFFVQNFRFIFIKKAAHIEAAFLFHIHFIHNRYYTSYNMNYACNVILEYSPDRNEIFHSFPEEQSCTFTL